MITIGGFYQKYTTNIASTLLKLKAKVIFLFHPTLRYLGGLPFNPLCG